MIPSCVKLSKANLHSLPARNYMNSIWNREWDIFCKTSLALDNRFTGNWRFWVKDLLKWYAHQWIKTDLSVSLNCIFVECFGVWSCGRWQRFLSTFPRLRVFCFCLDVKCEQLWNSLLLSLEYHFCHLWIPEEGQCFCSTLIWLWLHEHIFTFGETHEWGSRNKECLDLTEFTQDIWYCVL